MGKLNYYDFVSFPDREEREKIHQNFFDFGVLRLCENEIIPHDKETYHFKEIPRREAMRHKIKFFNNNTTYLDEAELLFVHYYNLFETENDSDKKLRYDILFKRAYRNMCMEIKAVEEKIKDFLRFVYNLSLEETMSDCKFINQLCKKLVVTEYGLKFKTAIHRYWGNINIKEITKVRNDETHNETSLLVSLDDNSENNNKIFFERIKNSLLAMLELRNELQEFLVKIYPDIKVDSLI